MSEVATHLLQKRIEQLIYERDLARAENEKLRAALKPFAAYVDQPTKIYEHEGVRVALVDQDVLRRLCRAAAAALKETGDE